MVSVTPERAKRAIDIEALLVCAYRDQKAHRVGVASPGGYIDSIVRVEAIAAVGCKIDCSVGYVAPHVHEDALAVVKAVELLAQPIQDVLVWRALAGPRPDWKLGARFRCEAALEFKGGRWQAVVQYEKFNGHRPMLCPVVCYDRPEYVDGGRWLALKALVQDLDGRLGSSILTGPNARSTPGNRPVPRFHEGRLSAIKRSCSERRGPAVCRQAWLWSALAEEGQQDVSRRQPVLRRLLGARVAGRSLRSSTTTRLTAATRRCSGMKSTGSPAASAATTAKPPPRTAPSADTYRAAVPGRGVEISTTCAV